MSHRSFQVTRIEPLHANVYRVLLNSATPVPAYHAGQYLELLLPDQDGNKAACAFSIASAPAEGQTELELHVQTGSNSAERIMAHLRSSSAVEVAMPKGNCHLGAIPDAPLVFVAAGTGFTQMKSMIEYCHAKGHSHPIHLYWGARLPDDLYLLELPQQWVANAKVQFHPVVSEASEEMNWSGRHGLLYEALVADQEHHPDAHIFISGSPQMVYATYDALVAAGFSGEHIHSDVFDYAPRS